MVDPAARRSEIESLAETLARDAGAQVHPDPELMAEHVELVEWPGLLAGSFNPEYLELPPEVVVTTLRYHQKCLVLEDAEGALRPGFIAVADRKDDPEGLIRQGNEWVIGARLADAEFFFNEDRKRAMADMVPGLERLEFHRVLGSLADKADRVGRLAATTADTMESDVDREVLKAAAPLAKADLLTNMVGEFPELQGVVGGHYLRLEGASRDLWTAVRDHYQPVGFDGTSPESEIGRLLGVADRLDTVAGLFAVGERPSGSKDPFGLRRAAQGAVKIVIESGWDLDLDSGDRSGGQTGGGALDRRSRRSRGRGDRLRGRPGPPLVDGRGGCFGRYSRCGHGGGLVQPAERRGPSRGPGAGSRSGQFPESRPRIQTGAQYHRGSTRRQRRSGAFRAARGTGAPRSNRGFSRRARRTPS